MSDNSEQKISDGDKQFLVAEYKRLSVDALEFFKSIQATEQVTVGGAAAIAAFLLTDLAQPQAAHAVLLSALPLFIVALGAVRCLSLFWALMNARKYLATLEARLLPDSLPGLHQSNTFGEARSVALVTTAIFWIFALGASSVFAVTYTLPAPS